MKRKISTQNKLLVVFGPTSSGKTRLSIEISKYIWGKFAVESEFINADSRQFYKFMDIGTNKIGGDILVKFKHHMLDIKEPNDKFKNEDYKNEVVKIIADIHGRNRLPILVGGSGTLVLDIVGKNHLLNLKYKKPELSYDTIMFIPDFDRNNLYRKIENNVDKMFDYGLYSEVLDLIKKYPDKGSQLEKTIGYSEFLIYCQDYNKDIMHLNNRDLENIARAIKSDTKKYAMHQIAWLKKLKNFVLVSDFQMIKPILDKFIQEYV